jgi:3-(3-hydroxy-phenyl)propionate hydroxylase
MKRQLPVCIVGAGPAGLAAATLLGRMGVRVLLLERRRTTAGPQRLALLTAEALRTCRALTLDGELSLPLRPLHAPAGPGPLPAAPAPAVPGSGTGGPAAGGSAPGGAGPGEEAPLASALQSDLEAFWRAGLSRVPGVEVRAGGLFGRLSQGPEDVTVVYSDAQGVTHWERCTYVLGCDGADSRVRASAGIPVTAAASAGPTATTGGAGGAGGEWAVLDVAGEAGGPATGTVQLEAAGAGVEVPGPCGTRRLAFRLAPGAPPLEGLPPEALCARLGRAHPLRPEEVLHRGTYAFPTRRAEALRRGRVLLLGEAAHQLPPLGGLGLDAALTDAFNLCWKLAAVLRGEAQESVLDTYAAERRAQVDAALETAAGAPAGVHGLTPLPAGPLLPGAAPGGGRVARALRALRGGVRAPGVPAGDGALALQTGRGSGRVRPGLALPQTDVRGVDGRLRRLDTVLGPGFALLVGAGEAEPPEVVPEHLLWDWLMPRRVHVHAAPTGRPGLRSDGVIRVVDAAGALALSHGQAVLVRPDRLVAGVFPLAQVDVFAERFARRYLTPASHAPDTGGRSSLDPWGERARTPRRVAP